MDSFPEVPSPYTFRIRVRGNNDIEPDETVIATLEFVVNPPAGVTLDPAKTTSIFTILNDDIASVTEVTGNACTDTYTLHSPSPM